MTTTTAKQSSRIPDHILAQAKAIDLADYAGRFVELRKEAANEWAGPCPKCGGTDRFHVTEAWFFCRQCHPERSDAIGFVCWLDGCGFRQAVDKLTGSVLPAPSHRRTAPAQTRQPQPADFTRRAGVLATRAHACLIDADEGQPGRDYLLGRGLLPGAWQRFRLGYAAQSPLPGTNGERRAPAIVIPWCNAAGSIVALRYRFLTAHTYTDATGKDRTEKQSALTGSVFAGAVYGGTVVERGGESGRTLVLCEGELNAISIWQAAAHTALDAYSLGSESATVPDSFCSYAGNYKRVIVWADRASVALGLRAYLPGSYSIQSPTGKDANDLLRAGLLGGFLTRIRQEAAQNSADLEGLLWDVWDGAVTNGVDAGTAQVFHKLSDKLGIHRRLVEVSPGLWGGAT